MKQVAESVWHLSGFPLDAINIYLADDVLIDAGTRYSHRRILRQVRGHQVTAHALTHAHPDHQGSSRRICEELNVPFWVGAEDAEAAERPELIAEGQPR